MARVKKRKVKKPRSGLKKKEKSFLNGYLLLMRACIEYKGIEVSENGRVRF
ncbi:DNA glycosylase [Corchorus capsularis]|uniref:DNA glycosylase n=1 Tax=Corchorus capsularis TaxID=210143 RepID=A0A1R3JAG1_COCAP|nr:DNA glycosylase [Corchorus capsularis]